MSAFIVIRVLLISTTFILILACCFFTGASLQLPSSVKSSIRLTGYVDQSVKRLENPSRSKQNYNGLMAKRMEAPRAFVIDQAKSPASDKESQEISQLVISVFFNEETELNKGERVFDFFRDIMTPLKGLQIAYLRNLYDSDLRQKRFVQKKEYRYDMFIAREVIADKIGEPSSTMEGLIYNKESLGASLSNLRRGKIIGFVDIIERPFGLISELNTLDPVLGSKSLVGKKSDVIRPLRPVLANLSVKKEFRKSGVGSALIACCENAIIDTWERRYNEILLEVEKDNLLAQQFYEKRGYRALFTDPACRRYDTSGLFLTEVRTSKICYRKTLDRLNGVENIRSNNNGWSLDKALRSLQKYMASFPPS